MIRIQQLKLPLDYTEKQLLQTAAKKLRIPEKSIISCRIVKRSLDARKKPEIWYVMTVDVRTENEKGILKKNKDVQIMAAEQKVYQFPEYGTEKMKNRPVIAGSGPAGLFCGLMLARAGFCPLILERGEPVDQRTKTVENFWETGELDTRSNIQFGEGGAGTFSDGKLNTAVKDPAGRNRFVLETFVWAGADEDILYVNKPHIGTDVLRNVVKRMREEIISLGGEVRFLSQLTDLETDGGHLTAVTVNGRERISCETLVLAIGHSARDTFEMLTEKQILMQPKSFAVGLRIEHPQTMINRYQYAAEHHPILPAADYKLTRKLSNQRGMYSFCMCPGGYVVNASSEEGMTAVNGMSYHARDSRNANSAMIVTVTPDDFEEQGVLGGVAFQRKLEKSAYLAGKGKVPVQLFGDFKAHRESESLGDVIPCIKGEYRLSNLRDALPGFLGDSLEEGILAFERQIEGFSREDAVLSGVESRTSSPVKIVRNEEYQSTIGGLYPCGEGAGYAGGITSAAMDGVKTAEAIIRRYTKL